MSTATSAQRRLADHGLSELSIASDGRDPPAAFLGKVTVADRAGCSRIWLANHLFQRDPIALGATALGASRDLRVALMAMSPFTVHPVQLAMAAATLDEFHPGRVGLCLGSGAPADLVSVGIDNSRPLVAVREALRLVRALLAGETVTFQGETYRVERAAARQRRPRRAADRSRHPGRKCWRWPEPKRMRCSSPPAPRSSSFAGRCTMSRAEPVAARVRRVGLVYAAVNDNAGRAHDRLRRILAITLRGPHHAHNLELAGNRLDQERLRAAVAAEDWSAAAALITDRIVETHAASGTPAQLAARLRAYRAAGLDEIVLAGVSRSRTTWSGSLPRPA